MDVHFSNVLLQEPVLERILQFLSWVDHIALSLTCKSLYSRIPKFKTDPAELLRVGAEDGNVFVCDFARKHGANDMWYMFHLGMKHKHPQICRLIFDWNCTAGEKFVNQYNTPFDINLVVEHPELHDLLIEYHTIDPFDLITHALHAHVIPVVRSLYQKYFAAGPLDYVRTRIYELIFEICAKSGDVRMCDLAYELGAREFNKLLVMATKMSNIELCIKAREYGANDFNKMLITAVQYRSPNLYFLAKDWGACNVDEMLITAARWGNVAACKQAYKWHAKAYRTAIEIAVEHNQRAICVLMHEMNICNYDHMLLMSLVHKKYEYYLLAKAWGAKCNKKMMKRAMNLGDDVYQLAIHWTHHTF